MNWKNKNVLLTGAGGFIGSHLLERLVELGADVTSFVRYNSRNDLGLIEHLPPKIKDRIKIVAGDLRDFDAVYDAMDGCEIVFHLAALIAIPYSYLHPGEVIETNVMGTYSVLNAARRLKVQKIVHTSTSEVYGTARQVPIPETHPLQGQSPYSASKIGADKIAESFNCAYGLPVATIRPFNTFGPRQSARAVIPTIISQALKGKVIQLGSLHPTRDLTFVKDTVEGFIAVAASPNSIGRAINIGSNFEISIGDLAKKIAKLMGKKIKIVAKGERKRPKKSEVARLFSDNSLAKELLGWQPRYTLDQGLQETIDWVKANLDMFKTDIYNV
jgi:NAD dependent epimerase/dehydratase